MMHKFLATFVDADWKAKHIERWVSLSGPWGGSTELSRISFYPDSSDFFNVPDILLYITLEELRTMANTFPSTFIQRPRFGTDDEIVLDVKVGDETRTYTKNDIGKALRDSGLLNAATVYEAELDAYDFHSLAAPGVTVDCIYGVGLQTITRLHFDNGFNASATGYDYESGDTVVPKRSLELCSEWNASIYEIPHTAHGGTLHDNASVAVFSKIMRGIYGLKPPPVSHQQANGTTMYI